VSEGLPANGVRSIIQDRRGFVWLGTDNGLCRYDGKRMEKFIFGLDTANQFVGSLLEFDRDIYIGSDHGLFVFEEETDDISKLYQKVNDTVINSFINSLCSTSDSIIWLSSSKQGVYNYNPRQNSFSKYNIENNDMCFVFADINDNIYASARNGNHPLYIKKRGDSGFRALDIPMLGPHSFASAMCQDIAGNLWIGTWTEGLIKIDTLGNISKVLEKKDHLLHIHCIREFEPGLLLIGSDNGLVQYNIPLNKWRLTTCDNINKHSLSSSFVYSITKDREGSLWVGTFYGGVNYSTSLHSSLKAYVSQSSINSLSGNVIGRFCEDDKHNIYIASDDGGVSVLNPKTGQFSKLFTDKNVHALCSDADNIWIGTYSDGIIKYNSKTGKSTVYTNKEGSGNRFYGTSSYSILKDSKGRIWATSWDGLHLYNAESDSFATIKPINGVSVAMKEDNHGNIWIASQAGGLYCINHDKRYFKQYESLKNDNTTLSSNEVNGMDFNEQGELWIATANGLCKYNPEKDNFSRIQLNLPTQQIMAVLCHNNMLWLTTTQGLVAFEEDRRLQIFTKSDGLKSEQFIPNSIFMDCEGIIYAGSTNGFATFDPMKTSINNQKPSVTITSIDITRTQKIIESKLNDISSVDLDEDFNSLTVSFVSLSFCNPDKNRFAFRVDGIDTTWNLTEKNSVSLMNIPTGEYLFRIKSANNSGIWSDETTLKINVKELPLPIHWAWWLPLAIILAGGIWIVWKRRNKSAQAQQAIIIEPQAATAPAVSPSETMAPVPDKNENADSTNDDDQKLLITFNKVVEENVANPDLKIEDIAEKMNFSRSSLYRKIKTISGKTPNELIQDIRLNYAHKLLRDKKYRVNEVAFLVGFNNASYFSKLFEKKFGTKPSEI